MDALKAEAHKIEAEIEEFSSRTAKEVASLVISMSEVEDENDKMIKRERFIDAEIETLVKEKEALRLSRQENEKRLENLSVKKNEMDKMVDAEMKKYTERDTEVKTILRRLSTPEPPRETSTSVDVQMVAFLRQTISRKEEDLLCPVCLEIAQTPIFTCPDSHIICSACVPKLKAQECPQCRVELPNPLKRDRFAEKTAVELEELLQTMKKLTDEDSQKSLEENVELPLEDPKQVEELVKLKNGVLVILNNISPQNFHILMGEFLELPITNQTHLQECVELIFEKALNKSGFSLMAARMCHVIHVKVLAKKSETETGNFRKLLLSRCQKEFDHMEKPDRNQYYADMAAAQTDEDCKQTKAVFEQKQIMSMSRNLGITRFIGELYKVQMVNARIMHWCIKKLLKADNESLECLCALLTTAGQSLDTDTKKILREGPRDDLNDLSVYCDEMKKISQDKKVWGRVLVQIQDVIQLLTWLKYQA